MYARTIIIVGDKFAQFAEEKDALTISQLRTMLKQDSLAMSKLSQITLVPGQGIGDTDAAKLMDEASNSTNRQHFDFSLWHNRPKRAESNLSHKSNPENTLISVPQCLYEDCYKMQLMVDENCEQMSDHQSGQHVQGMVLFEAARQSLLVVTEAFYITDSATKYAFVFNKMGVHYNQFAFPFDAELIYEIREKNTRKKTRMSFTVDIRIEQCGVTTASFDAEFSVFRNEVISSREKTLAGEALDTHITNTTQQRVGLIVNG
ncbi:MAG: hypothetical protein ACI93R_002334 [Flavobacteriales bacterium]|jgi:hypothetical protein